MSEQNVLSQALENTLLTRRSFLKWSAALGGTEMAKPTRKKSLAKQFAEAERLSLFGSKPFPMGPIGLWVYAERYRDGALRLSATENAEYDPVRHYLVCHAIELALKAFLSLRGMTLLELSEGAYGHNLDTILASADSKGMAEFVSLTDEHRAEIRDATLYYAGKVFEYPALSEAVVAYKRAPDISILLSAASALIEALAEPCREVNQ